MIKNNHKGFTLTEIVLAILIVSGTILSIVSVFTYGANYSLRIKNQAEGEKILVLMAEEIQKNPYKVPKNWDGSPISDNSLFPFGSSSGVSWNFKQITNQTITGTGADFNLEEREKRYDYKVKVTRPPLGLTNPTTLLQEVDLTVKGPLEENGNDKYKGGTKMTKEYDMKFYIPILIQ